jgi:hypothetical protein
MTTISRRAFSHAVVGSAGAAWLNGITVEAIGRAGEGPGTRGSLFGRAQGGS